MNTPKPINAARTRVILMANGVHMAQVSTDGLSWLNIMRVGDDALTCQNEARSLYHAASTIPHEGKTVWDSQKDLP